MKLSEQTLISYFYQATLETLGLYIETSDPPRLRQKLYAARRSDPSLSSFQIRLDPNGQALWILPPQQEPFDDPTA